jgi:hypothetical protein
VSRRWEELIPPARAHGVARNDTARVHGIGEVGLPDAFEGAGQGASVQEVTDHHLGAYGLQLGGAIVSLPR